MRPSRLLQIHDEWAAHQLDSAVLYLGRWVENKLSELDDKGKPKHKLRELLADPEQAVEMNARDAIAMLRATRGAVRVHKVVRKQSAEG